jgi:hypothetical protein
VTRLLIPHSRKHVGLRDTVLCRTSANMWKEKIFGHLGTVLAVFRDVTVIFPSLSAGGVWFLQPDFPYASRIIGFYCDRFATLVNT